MTASIIEISGASYAKSFLMHTSAGQSVLCGAKSSTARPKCLCNGSRPEMYISRRGSNFYLARMPGSGNEHADGCRSHIADGDCVVSAELTADDILGKLWAGMLADGKLAGRKQWAAIREGALSAAAGLRVDGKPFTDRLLVPETFSVKTADKLNSTYDAFYLRQRADDDKQARYWTLGFLRESVERPYSFQVTLKQMPNTKFWVHKEVASAFPVIAPGAMLACLFSCRLVRTGVEVDEAGVLMVDEELRPILPLPSRPTDEQIALARKRLGLPDSAGADAVFGTLINQLLSTHPQK